MTNYIRKVYVNQHLQKLRKIIIALLIIACQPAISDVSNEKLITDPKTLESLGLSSDAENIYMSDKVSRQKSIQIGEDIAANQDVKKFGDGIGVLGLEVREQSRVGTIDPKRTNGAPYQPVDPVVETTFIPNEGHINFPPVPVGPLRGKIEPKNPAIKIVGKKEGPSQEINFEDYKEVNDVLPNLSSLGEVSVAENGETIIMTGNTWMALSEDAGGTFTYIPIALEI